MAGPDDPASSLLDQAPLAGALLAVVVASGRVIGMVTADDIGRLVQQSMLREKATPSRAD
jgi:CBS domain containing-hemolysin-like protein